MTLCSYIYGLYVSRYIRICIASMQFKQYIWQVYIIMLSMIVSVQVRRIVTYKYEVDSLLQGYHDCSIIKYVSTFIKYVST